MCFYDFFLVTLKKNLTQKVEKSRNLALFGPFWTPKCPFSRKWPNFGPGGKNTRKLAFFWPKFMPETIFDGFWVFLRFFDFFDFSKPIVEKIACFVRPSLMFSNDFETSGGHISSTTAVWEVPLGFLDAPGFPLQKYIKIEKVPKIAGNRDFWSALP